MSIEGFERVSSIPGTRKGHTYAQGCAHVQGHAHAQESIEKALSSHLRLSLQTLTSDSIQEMKAKAELSTAWLSVKDVSKHTHRVISQTLGGLLIEGI